MTGYIGFADFTHTSVPKIPASPTTPLAALYATGSAGIEATAADITKYRSAGTGVILIDQTPGLYVFAAGLADVADVEYRAGTSAAAANAVLARQAHGWQSTLYVSYSALPGLRAALHPGTDRSKVLYGVADYSWSLQQSEQLLSIHPDWAYIQYGDPASNPRTLIPGTQVTLAQGNADIDVAKMSWAGQFLPPAPGTVKWVTADGTSSLHAIAAAHGDNTVSVLRRTIRAETIADPALGAWLDKLFTAYTGAVLAGVRLQVKA